MKKLLVLVLALCLFIPALAAAAEDEEEISFYTEDASKSKWVYMPHDDDNYYMLPRMEGLQLAYYDKRILAVGKEGNVYLSPDQGITWRKNSVYALPEALTGQVAAMTTDKDGRVWLVTTTGQLWIGYV